MRAAAVFFVVYLAIQVIVPVLRLFDARPSRWGWQMYAGTKAPISADLIREDGTMKTVPVAFYLGNYRSDLDLLEALPPYLCKKDPRTKVVRLNFGNAPSRDFPCR
jgi:hypothetical protein